MAIATGTALAIGAGISGGASLYGAHKASKAAKDAAAAQERSAQQALGLQQQMYQQTRGDLSPYRQYGVGALAAGHQLMGLPTPAAEPAYGMTPLSQVGQTRGPLPPGATPSRYAVPRGTMPGPGGPGGMVLLKAPTGEVQPVPIDHVDYYLARGATRG